LLAIGETKKSETTRIPQGIDGLGMFETLANQYCIVAEILIEE
jgi:hypothetical protein